MNSNVQPTSPSRNLLGHLPHWRTGAYAGVLLLVAACGGSSRAGDSTGTGGDGGSAGSKSGTGGSSGGVAGSGGDGGTAASGAVGGGGAGTGGDATGGAATGGSGGDGGTSAGMGGVSGSGASGGVGNTGGTTGGNGGTGGSSGASGAVGTLGDPCDTPAELACAGNRQRVVLICGGDGKWETAETCDAGQVCDSTPGVDQGSCKEQVPECAALDPGARYCAGQTLMECGPDNATTSVVEECERNCVGDACDDGPDPCPEGSAQTVNCAEDCGGPDATGCNNCERGVFRPLGSNGTVRLGDEIACKAACDDTIRVVEVYLVDSSVTPPGQVRVSPPWQVALPNADEPVCELEGSQCVERSVVTSGLSPVYVFTEDPDPPPTNVYVQFGTTFDEPCP